MSSKRAMPSRASKRRNRFHTEPQVDNHSTTSTNTGENLEKEVAAANKNVAIASASVELHCAVYASEFMFELYQLYRQGICCDVVLSDSNGFLTSAHKIVLMASSPYFRSLLLSQGSANIICLPPEVDHEYLQPMITFLYTGTLYLNSNNVFHMLATASQLQIKPAHELCQKFLSETRGPSIVKDASTLKFEVPDTGIPLMTDVQIKEEISSLPIPSESCSSDDNGETFESFLPETRSCRPKAVVDKVRKTSGLRRKSSRRKQQSSSVSSKAKGRRSSRLLKNLNSVTKSKSSRNTRAAALQSSRHKRFIASPALIQWATAPGTTLRCQICNSGFQRRCGLQFHLKSFHNSLLQSPGCRRKRTLLHRSILTLLRRIPTSQTNGGVARLEQRHFCVTCKRSFARNSELLAHVLKRHPYEHEMIYRDRSKLFARKSLLKRKSSQCFKCPSCVRSFLHRSNLKAHVVASHKRTKADSGREKCRGGKKRNRFDWSCQQNDCGARFSSAIQLKKHMAIQHTDVVFSCQHCRFTSQVEQIFQRHQAERHGKLIMCDICGKGCHKLYLLKEHMYIHHKIKDPSLKLFQCPVEGCSYECSSRKRLEDHSVRHTLKKSLTCDMCGKKFKHTIGLERHISAIHHGIRPYICDQCGMAFGLVHDLKTHVARHSNNKPHACDHCPYRTFDKINLQSHLFSQHNVQTNQKVLILNCDLCPFTTNRRGRYEDHMKMHDNIRDVACPECGKLFYSKRNLYGHTVKVHRPKSLHCSMCSFSTAIRSKFNEHMSKMHSIHTEKFFECPVCKYRSASAGNCRKHIQKHHPNVDVAPVHLGESGNNKSNGCELT